MPLSVAHSHLRVRNLEETLHFLCKKLGLVEVMRNIIEEHGLTWV